uniref:Uncharacterized protein n=1 Tax=Panagrolaimus sp. ES5 TaxID=591445 RepID=A0AC34GPQ6_9BILA
MALSTSSTVMPAPKKLDRICAKLWSKQNTSAISNTVEEKATSSSNGLIKKTTSDGERYSSIGKPEKLPFSIDSLLSPSTSSSSINGKDNGKDKDTDNGISSKSKQVQLDHFPLVFPNITDNIFYQSIIDFTQNLQKSSSFQNNNNNFFKNGTLEFETQK